MSLFQTGFFQLHSGESSNFKIDCDFLTDEDINAIALQLVHRLPTFRTVEGVPTGGLRLAEALQQYVVPQENGWYKDVGYPLLIVDDVFTTGGSVEEHRAGRYEAIGAVIFARNPTPSWITPLFRMEP
jgi:orotate phosphoribosyltransferase